MTPVAVGRFIPGSPEWTEARRTRLGGSEIAAVLGLSPWTSPFTLWHVKAGSVEPEPGNRWTEWGHRLEPVVAAKFLDEHPEMTPEHLAQGVTYEHDDRRRQPARDGGPPVLVSTRKHLPPVLEGAA